MKIWHKTDENRPKKWQKLIGIERRQNTDSQENLVGVLTRNANEKVEARCTPLVAFSPPSAARCVCGVSSLMHWKGQRGNMMDLSRFSPWPSADSLFNADSIDPCLTDDWVRCHLTVLPAIGHVQVYLGAVGPAHIASSAFEVRRGDGWRDRVRGLCARERNARALQRPARSLLGSSAQQLIPGCFPFSAGGASPPLWNTLSLFLSALHTDLNSIGIRPHSTTCSSPCPFVPLFVTHCTVDSFSPVPRFSASSHF